MEDAIRIAARFVDVPEERVRYDTLLTESDQWTMTQGRQLPMYKLRVDDEAGSQVYVSARLGEVVQFTTRRGRALSWISVIPHFMYFKSLRMNADLWLGIMTWGSGLGVAVALLGIVLGVIHFRPKRPFRLSSAPSGIPYRGWLRWHHAAGLVFGVVTLAFVFSGLLSLEPWEWNLRDFSLEDGTREAFPSGTGNLEDYAPIDAAAWRDALGGAEIKEIAFTRILGEPHFVARGAPAVPAAIGWPDGGHQPYFVERSVDPQRSVLTARGMELRRPTDRNGDAPVEPAAGNTRFRCPGHRHAPRVRRLLLFARAAVAASRTARQARRPGPDVAVYRSLRRPGRRTRQSREPRRAMALRRSAYVRFSVLCITGARSGTPSSSSSAWAARCSAALESCSASSASSAESIE